MPGNMGQNYLQLLQSSCYTKCDTKNCTGFGTSSQPYAKVYIQSKRVKCTLVQALRLCTGCMAHTGSRGIALLFHGHGTRRG
jgi:hypothetical protein